jgi:ABC-2 type transport system ATP-binding protein
VRSLMHEPKVLFLDEPTSGLDPVSRKNLWEYLKEVRKRQNTTVFLTTHYLEEAEGSDNICVINKGKVVAAGSPADVKKKFTKKFLILSSKNKSDLTNELVNLKVPFIDEGKIKVAVKGGEAQQIIAKLKTHLTDFELFNPSLEEAYIQIIKEGNETN